MKPLLIILSLIMICAVPVSSIAKSKNELPEYTVEGLKRIPDTKDIAVVYAEPGATLEQYKRVFLVEAAVAFKKNWQRDQSRGLTRVSSRDMERIKNEVKKLFAEVFTEELQKGGYEMATERAEDVLIVRPAIIDLNINAPDVGSSGMSQTYTTTAGSMTLYLELYDSETDDLLAKAIDPTYDRNSGYMQWATSVSNRAAARRMMKPWAEVLRKGLDEAHAATKKKEE
ncbi:MAG: DUF3313 family protein [Xanthomonadales bacterium]|nr:DUF3313 family protein [Xanthomonadales bacterium]